AKADETAGVQGRLLTEVARQLAVRMSYEDVVRVAQAKIAPERMRRIALDELRVSNEPFTVHDFLKPGIEELTQLLPPALARPILRTAERKGWLGRVHFGMEINTTSISGYLRFLMLAKLRRVRPYGIRYRDRGMRPPHQRLWRHACARPFKLSTNRGARDPSGAGGQHPTSACGR